MLFTRILTDLERRRLNAFKVDGEKKTAITQLAARCRRHLPRIREDLALIERFMDVYEKTKKA